MHDESTWLGLAAAQETQAPIDIRHLTETMPAVLRALPPDALPGPMEGVDGRYARLAILSGRQACAAAAAALAPIVDRAIDVIDAQTVGRADAEHVSSVVSLLNLLTGLRGTGHRPAGADDARAADWLGWIGPAIAEIGPEFRRRAACTATAHGDMTLARRVLADLPDDEELASLRGVVDGVDGGDPSAIEARWAEYLFAFTGLRVANKAAFGDLISIGRAVYVLAGSTPEAELTEWIRRDLW